MEILPTLKFLCGALALFLFVCYFYQVVYLVLPLLKKKKAVPEDTTPRRYAILIAARNEELVIPHLLDSIQNQQYPSDCITTYVVADNCTDHTADVARKHGARVLRRFNQQLVGKGYALHDLIEWIRKTDGIEGYDDFLIFDADNLLEPDYIARMNTVVNQGYEAFCGYRNTKNFDSNWLSAGYGVWYLHDSTHMNRSRMLLGTCCAVSGTGFGFSRALLERLDGWNFFTLTEDIEFSTWCATHGVTIGYCHDAVLYDEQPSDFGASWRQRTRWAQGGVQIVRHYSGMLFRGLFQGGKASYSTYEAATLSMWGFTVSTVFGALTMLLAYLTHGWMGMAELFLLGTVCGYFSAAAMGAITVFMEWDRILASTGKKILSIFEFPLFMMTFLPITLTAIFRKFQWEPTRHTVAISNTALKSK